MPNAQPPTEGTYIPSPGPRLSDPYALNQTVGTCTSSISAQNRRGEWVPAIPLPLYLPFGLTRCECGRKFLGERRYRGHYALVHILGQD